VSEPVRLRYVPVPEAEKPPDMVDVLLRREAAVLIGQYPLKLIEPPLRFYTDLLRKVLGSGDAGLLVKLGTALKAVAAQGSQAEVEATLLDSFIGESSEAVCEFLARLLRESNEDTNICTATGLAPEHLSSELSKWLSVELPASGLAALLDSALYVCDVATLRGFFVRAAAQWRGRRS